MFLLKMKKNYFLCLLKLDSLIKKFTSIYNTACDKLIMHCTYEAIILQHHQIQSSKGAREESGCSFLQQRKNFFLLHLCCMQFFSSDERLQEIFFKITPSSPPPPLFVV